MKDYLMAIHKDEGFLKDNNYPKYEELKGFIHIWDYFKTEEGNFISSKYKKEVKNGLWQVSAKASLEGWVIHMFYGGSKFKSWFVTVDSLKEVKELTELFLSNRLVMNKYE